MSDSATGTAETAESDVRLTAADVERVVAEALAAFDAADDLDQLKQARLDHLGDRSVLAKGNRTIGQLPTDQRKEAGRLIGQAKGSVTRALAEREATLTALRDEQILATERVDVTLPAATPHAGARHPLSMLADEIADVFTGIGWSVVEGPQVEAEWLNFDALNFTPDHPARQMQDTFFVDPPGSGLLLRTHTSPAQARTMLSQEPPIHIICPGRAFRTDELDATHSPVFGQVEGLVVDRGITMAHLKGVLDYFAKQMFGEDIVIRLRPSFFPFTEPSAEPDLQCFVCHGESVGNPDRPCRTCGSEGWIEWGGCGLVNPRVLIACGIDPDEYSGMAFGMGIERTLMFRNAIEDMREMVEGDVRFSEQFGLEV